MTTLVALIIEMMQPSVHILGKAVLAIIQKPEYYFLCCVSVFPVHNCPLTCLTIDRHLVSPVLFLVTVSHQLLGGKTNIHLRFHSVNFSNFGSVCLQESVARAALSGRLCRLFVFVSMSRALISFFSYAYGGRIACIIVPMKTVQCWWHIYRKHVFLFVIYRAMMYHEQFQLIVYCTEIPKADFVLTSQRIVLLGVYHSRLNCWPVLAQLGIYVFCA